LTVDPGRAHARPVVSEAPAGAKPGVSAEGDEDEDLGPLPWHLKLLAAALALYLGYRAFQGIEWVVHQL
jgi:hypothetical protein